MPESAKSLIFASTPVLVALLLGSCRSSRESVMEEPLTPQEEMEQAMAIWSEVAEPGLEHRLLTPLEGEFTARVQAWREPGSEPEHSQGRMSNRWILGGRFLQGTYRGTLMGQPFDGVSLLGYDKARERFVGVWMDSMSTLLMPISEGASSKKGKVITLERTWFNPMMRAEATMREVTTIHSHDQHTFEIYEIGPEGEQRKTLEILYTRVR